MKLLTFVALCSTFGMTDAAYSQSQAKWRISEDKQRFSLSVEGKDSAISFICGPMSKIETWISDPGKSFEAKKISNVILTALHSTESHEIRQDKDIRGGSAIVFTVGASSLMWTALLMDRGFALYNAPQAMQFHGDGASSLVKDFIPRCLNAISAARETKTPGSSTPETKNGTMPRVVSDFLTNLYKGCKKPNVQNDFIKHGDVNGDGLDDWILNFDNYTCGDEPNEECGTGGCTVKVFASIEGGYKKVFDNQVWDMVFKKDKNEYQMVLKQHGMYCGKVGAEGCTRVSRWNGSSFEFLTDRTGEAKSRREVRMPPIRYDLQRKNMIKDGYSPIRSNENCNINRREVCGRYHEVEDCSGTGLGYCNFLWRKNDNIIEIITTGETPADLVTVKSVSCGARRC